jgi:hypothetical protein
MVWSFGVHSAAVFGSDGAELVTSSRTFGVPGSELKPFERAAVSATPPVILERHISDGIAVTFRLPIRGDAPGTSRGLAVLRHYPSQRLLAELTPPPGTAQPVSIWLLVESADSFGQCDGWRLASLAGFALQGSRGQSGPLQAHLRWSASTAP